MGMLKYKLIRAVDNIIYTGSAYICIPLAGPVQFFYSELHSILFIVDYFICISFTESDINSRHTI